MTTTDSNDSSSTTPNASEAETVRTTDLDLETLAMAAAAAGVSEPMAPGMPSTPPSNTMPPVHSGDSASGDGPRTSVRSGESCAPSGGALLLTLAAARAQRSAAVPSAARDRVSSTVAAAVASAVGAHVAMLESTIAAGSATVSQLNDRVSALEDIASETHHNLSSLVADVDLGRVSSTELLERVRGIVRDMGVDMTAMRALGDAERESEPR